VVLKIKTSVPTGAETVPTSPLSATMDGLERQKRRLQEASQD
jgi:hypothetical protein